MTDVLFCGRIAILSPSRQKLVVAAILGLFLSLGAIYSVVDPIFESSDELSHYPYVKYMADGRGLPVQRPGEETLWDQEGSQPPLYYALAAALTSWINTDDLPIVRRINPHAQLGVPLGQDNKNMIIHTSPGAVPLERHSPGRASDPPLFPASERRNGVLHL